MSYGISKRSVAGNPVGAAAEPQRAAGARVGLLAARAAVALAVIALAAFGAAVARADGPVSSDPENPFNPSLSVSSDQDVAGAYPDLTIRLTKPANHCLVVEKFIDVEYCYSENAYEEQDFKRLELTLPAGIAADANAASACEPVESQESLWYCPPETQIGTVSGEDSTCLENEEPHGCGDQNQYEIGEVYMGQPEPGEQARLIVLVGLKISIAGLEIYIPDAARADIVITVDSAGRLTAVVDDIPDTAYDTTMDFYYPAQMDDVAITLWGDTGLDSGHPLITHSTSCSGGSFEGEAQGYAYNAYYEYGGSGSGVLPGYGDGKTASVSDSYNVTGCDDISYDPQIAFDLSPATPGAAPELTTKLTQSDGEATTGKVVVTFPSDFKLNYSNTNGQCTEEEFDSHSCPDDSVIGEATADSRLLPDEQGPVTGSVYLGPTDFSEGNVNLYMHLSNDFLPDGIDIRGSATMQEDGTIVSTFDDLPELPISSFEMTLYGGNDKSLMLLPESCGSKIIDTTLESTYGKQVKRSTQVYIPCGDASFDVTLGTRRRRASPTLNLDVSSPGISSLSLEISRYFKIAKRGDLDIGDRYGYLTLDSDEGTEELKVKLLKADNLGSLKFSATKGGAKVVSLGAYDKALEGQSKKKLSSKSKRTKGSTSFWINGIPSGTTGFSLELEGSKDRILTNPSNCRNTKGHRIYLGFTANLVDIEGTKHTMHEDIKMRCKASSK